MFLAKLQEKRNPLRQNPYLISTGIIYESAKRWAKILPGTQLKIDIIELCHIIMEISTKRWISRFKWIRTQFPGFFHGGKTWKF